MATAVAAVAGPQSASGEKDAAGQDTPGASGEDSAYPPIIVTAQKRSQTLIDVPQSVSVVSGDLLERQNATTFADYLKDVPSLQLVQGTPGQGRLVLRGVNTGGVASTRSEEHTSELQSLMRISYAVICLTKKKNNNINHMHRTH